MEGLEVICHYENDHIIASRDRKFPIPAVVRCPLYVKRNSKGVAFSRKNIFLRDRLTCQYCGKCDNTTKSLTFDHVVPRSTWKKENYKGTPTNWTNIVTCCEPCNKFKANRTPKESRMKLLKKPRQPDHHDFILGLSPWSRVPTEWELYLTPLYRHLSSDNRPN